MKRYVVLVAYRPSDWEEASPEVRQEYVDAHHAFEEFVDSHGRRVSSAPLDGADTATTLRHGPDGWAVTDGPFVESVEMIGGYYDVELPDLDSAIAAGQLLPTAYSVEIRPTIVVG